MQVKTIVDFLHTLAPPELQESYDNSGFLIGDELAEVSGVLISLDVTEAVLDEALSLDANLIISHHPIIFSGLKRLTGNSFVESVVIKALKNDLNLMAIDTNLDHVDRYGVNRKICEALGLRKIRFLNVKGQYGDGKSYGSGMIGTLEEAVDELTFLKRVKETMGASCIRHTALLGTEVRTIAVCGGSGRFLLEEALRQNADVYVTSDFKYHDFFDAHGKIVVADIGHYESEQLTIQLLHGILTENFNNFACHCTKVNTNPINYLI